MDCLGASELQAPRLFAVRRRGPSNGHLSALDVEQGACGGMGQVFGQPAGQSPSEQVGNDFGAGAKGAPTFALHGGGHRGRERHIHRHGAPYN